MRIIVTGDRNWNAVELAEEVLARLIYRCGVASTIVHGGATGIDRAFAIACVEQDIQQEPLPARWDELDHLEAAIRRDASGRKYNANAGPSGIRRWWARPCAWRSIGRFRRAEEPRIAHAVPSRPGYRPIWSLWRRPSRSGSWRVTRG